MSQFLRPNSDIIVESWITEPLFSSINSDVLDDSTFIISPQQTLTAMEVAMSAVNNPGAGARVLRIRARKTNSQQRGLDWALKVNDIVVQSGILSSNLGLSFSTVSINITEPISNYSSVSLQLIATGSIGGPAGNRSDAEVSWVEIEVPDGLPTTSIIGSSVAEIGQSSGLIDNQELDLSRNISGESNGLIGFVIGDVDKTIPEFNLSGDSNGLKAFSNGQSIVSAPEFELSGVSYGLMSLVSSDAIITVPEFNLLGSAIGIIGESEGSVDFSVEGYDVSGDSIGLIGSSEGVIERQVPAYTIIGNSQAKIGDVYGESNSIIPVVEIQGGIVGLIGNISSSASFGSPIFEIESNTNGLIGNVSALASSSVPDYSALGSSIGLKGKVFSEINNQNPLINLSGQSIGLIGEALGIINNDTPSYELNGNLTGLLGNSESNANYNLNQTFIQGSSFAPIGQVDSLIELVNSHFEITGSSVGLIGFVNSSFGFSGLQTVFNSSMGRSMPVNFRIHIPEPVEVKMVSLDLAKRDAIPNLERFKGLFTYVVSEDTFYYLSGGTTNSHWKAIGKPTAVEILDSWSDQPQTIISGYGLKAYLEANYVSGQQLQQALDTVRVADHVKNITQQEIDKWNSIKGDSHAIHVQNTPSMTWVCNHGLDKYPSAQVFLMDGKKIEGRVEHYSLTITTVKFAKPRVGYVTFN